MNANKFVNVRRDTTKNERLTGINLELIRRESNIHHKQPKTKP